MTGATRQAMKMPPIPTVSLPWRPCFGGTVSSSTGWAGEPGRNGVMRECAPPKASRRVGRVERVVGGDPARLQRERSSAVGLRATARAFEAINRYGPLSRSALRRAVGVGLSTVTTAVQQLVEEGYVVEAGQAASTGG